MAAGLLGTRLRKVGLLGRLNSSHSPRTSPLAISRTPTPAKIAGDQSMLVEDNDEYVRAVLRRALGEDKANLLLDRILQGDDVSGIESLKWMEPSTVAELMRHEHPQIVAAILVHLESDHAAEVLKLFSERQRNEVLVRVATLDGIQPAALKELNDVLTALRHGATLDEIGARLRKAFEEDRHNEVMYHVGRPGHDGYMDRVLQSWGVDGHNSHTNVCSAAARLGYALLSGGDRPSPDHAHAKFILLLSSHLETGHYFNPHAQRIMEGKVHGNAKLVVLDPRLSNTASHADLWLSPWPGSEAATGCSTPLPVSTGRCQVSGSYRAPTVTTCTPRPIRALRYTGNVAIRVLPSPVRISAIWPWCKTIPPKSCTSKCRIPKTRTPASRTTANASGSS